MLRTLTQKVTLVALIFLGLFAEVGRIGEARY
jgi:hypothetical protein